MHTFGLAGGPAARLRRALGRGGLMLAAAVLASPAFAQQEVVERYQPPAPERFAGHVTIADEDYGSADPTPLGVDLAGIRLIGPSEAVGPDAGGGIAIGAVEGAPETQLIAALQPYLSRPLSLALIAEIQATVARVWRGTGYPFVSVTAPPQDVTAGVLRLRVIEARMGEATAEGAVASRGDRLAASLRGGKGERIAARRVEEDVRWMNRHGMRHVEAIFAAGDENGESDLVLKVTDEKRWQAFAGWSNTGSAATGTDRYFAGVGAWVPELNDFTVSYQLTGSYDFWSRPDRIALRQGDFPSYLGHAGRAVLPLAARQAVEFSPAFVATRETPDPLTAFETTTLELPLVYRAALSELVPGLHFGDVFAGVALKRLHRQTYFAGVPVANGDAGLFQVGAGWSHDIADRFGRTAVELGVTYNPGGVAFGNDNAIWAAFSGGRVTSVNYAYLSADILRQTWLPHGFSLTHQLSARLASGPLPETERLQLGGAQFARGFGIDDGTADSGIVLRNELRLPPVSLAAGSGLSDALSAYVFLDVAHGHDIFLNRSTTLASAGAGFDYDLGGHLNLGLAAGVALTDGLVTRRGDIAVHGRVVGRF